MTTANEYTLVEKPILDALKFYGYTFVHHCAHPSQRAGENEVLFKPHLIQALKRISGISESDAEAVCNDVAKVTDNQRWIDILLGNYSRKIDGEANHRTIRLIDVDNVENNDFRSTSQLRVKGEVVRKPDIVVYVNGVPLVVIEAKSPTNTGQTIFDTVD